MIDEYKVGDMVYVDGKRKNQIEIIKETIVTTNNPNYEKILSCVGQVGDYIELDIENIWNSFPKAKERKEYLEKIGFNRDITKKKFITLVENKWNQYCLNEENGSWEEFLKTFR